VEAKEKYRFENEGEGDECGSGSDGRSLSGLGSSHAIDDHDRYRRRTDGRSKMRMAMMAATSLLLEAQLDPQLSEHICAGRERRKRGETSSLR
jgi:hypothetical protein